MIIAQNKESPRLLRPATWGDVYKRNVYPTVIYFTCKHALQNIHVFVVLMVP